MSNFFQKTAKAVSGMLDKLTLKFSKPMTSAIITVGGSGTRMQSADGTTKQFMLLDGMPIVARTVIEFQSSPYIDEIVIVAKSDEIELYTKIINKYGLTKVTKIVEGGETRQESVLNGFKAVSEEADYVAIHDGVRCLITGENIKDVVKAAYTDGCACAASKIYDTLKMADSNMFIQSTPDRNFAWSAQTPQVFRASVYRACAFSAKKEGLVATDDCMLVENYGFKIKLVDCGRNNLKITTKEDLIIADAILKSRQSAEEENK
ncbi:MAG: 2-C-methyl-D-erythritol 4-phosphate cytidylyltransferase [Clostridia bacterium]|nr:2-C-methyl-D-erythritol 4-phosphate cytidylyltransferase [Clostridia bacterium]